MPQTEVRKDFGKLITRGKEQIYYMKIMPQTDKLAHLKITQRTFHAKITPQINKVLNPINSTDEHFLLMFLILEFWLET